MSKISERFVLRALLYFALAFSACALVGTLGSDAPTAAARPPAFALLLCLAALACSARELPASVATPRSDPPRDRLPPAAPPRPPAS